MTSTITKRKPNFAVPYDAILFLLLSSTVYFGIVYYCGIVPNNKSLILDNQPSTQPSRTTTTRALLLQRLSRRETFLSTLEELYAKYGSEIAAFRPVMRTWCQTLSQSCKFCDTEAEMLYMLIREIKPKNVFEMAPNRGYSSHWILQALVSNNEGHLYSYDIHDASIRFMKNPEFVKRWTFTLGDYRDLLKRGTLDLQMFDFIFIDALHTEEFSREYCQKILHPIYTQPEVFVAIHDIVADPFGGGRESSEVYKFLAFATDRIVPGTVFTMSLYVMPNLNAPIVPPSLQEHKSPDKHNSAVQLVNEIRAKYGVIQPCREEQCSNPLHDVVYFENGDSPTIFFALSSGKSVDKQLKQVNL
jgi:predicted O-methyltransferase YrrM